MLKLQAAIKYGEEDLAAAKSLVDQCSPDDTDTDINRGDSKIKSFHNKNNYCKYKHKKSELEYQKKH